jgi:HEAT repeat protein
MASLATQALLALLVLAIVLGAALVVGRAVRRTAERRRSRLAGTARRALLAVAGGDDDPAHIQALARLDGPTWRAIEPTAVAMLGKVRGEAHEALVALFEQRGAATRALVDLRRPGAVRRARAAELLGNLGRAESVPPLCALLTAASPEVRVVAARSLGRIGEPAAAGPLLAALTGRRAIPAHFVAHAVLRLGTGTLPALAAALVHDDPLVRATAADVLGLAGAVTATPRLVAALAADTAIEVRVRAATALGRLGTRSALAPLLEAVAPDRPPALRAAAARALGELGAATAAATLAGLLRDPAYAVAHAAAEALRRLGNAGRAVLLAAAEDAALGARLSTMDPASRAAAHAREALAASELAERRRSALAAVGT